jgi:predicted HicB family RNase H-like nuclease
MAKKRGPIKRFTGGTVNVRLPGLLQIRLNEAAEAQKKNLSELVRVALEEKYGQGAKEQG